MTALPHDAQSAIAYGSGQGSSSVRARAMRRARARGVALQSKASPVQVVSQMPTRAFVAIIAFVLTLTLAAVLALNTLLAQGSFARYELLTKDSELVIREQALAAQVAEQENPQALASSAHALGMVPNAAPVYINGITGEVVGEPTPAPSAEAPAALNLRGQDRPAEAGAATGPTGPGGEQPIGLRPVESAR